jgi:large subunit ribosomal protein L9
MEIILLEKVENLGGIGDKVKVRPGYGRNFLIPQGKATLATPENIAAFEVRRAELEARAADEITAARGRAKLVSRLKLVIERPVGAEGKLFGSVGTIDIAEAATAAGVEIARSEVRLPDDGPIRIAGEHIVEIHLHSDVSVELPIIVGSVEAAEAARAAAASAAEEAVEAAEQAADSESAEATGDVEKSGD